MCIPTRCCRWAIRWAVRAGRPRAACRYRVSEPMGRALSGSIASSPVQPCQVFQVLLALLGPAVVAGLVLGTDQGVGPAALVGRQVEVAARLADCPLDVTTFGFGGFEGPHPALGIGQKTAEFGAATTAARERAHPPPVLWCFQGLRDAGAQVVEANGAQLLHWRRSIVHGGQFANGRDENCIDAVSLGPGENMVRRPAGQSFVDLLKSSQ